jgi:hypothetical protein
MDKWIDGRMDGMAYGSWFLVLGIWFLEFGIWVLVFRGGWRNGWING